MIEWKPLVLDNGSDLLGTKSSTLHSWMLFRRYVTPHGGYKCQVLALQWTRWGSVASLLVDAVRRWLLRGAPTPPDQFLFAASSGSGCFLKRISTNPKYCIHMFFIFICSFVRRSFVRSFNCSFIYLIFGGDPYVATCGTIFGNPNVSNGFREFLKPDPSNPTFFSASSTSLPCCGTTSPGQVVSRSSQPGDAKLDQRISA